MLYQPQIPQNTGAIGRQILGSEHAKLHLIGKLGFSLESSKVKRAGLDYWKNLEPHLHYYPGWNDFQKAVSQSKTQFGKKYWFTKKAKESLFDTQFEFQQLPSVATTPDITMSTISLCFGSEVSGIDDIREELERSEDSDFFVKIPMSGSFSKSRDFTYLAEVFKCTHSFNLILTLPFCTHFIPILF